MKKTEKEVKWAVNKIWTEDTLLGETNSSIAEIKLDSKVTKRDGEGKTYYERTYIVNVKIKYLDFDNGYVEYEKESVVFIYYPFSAGWKLHTPCNAIIEEAIREVSFK